MSKILAISGRPLPSAVGQGGEGSQQRQDQGQEQHQQQSGDPADDCFFNESDADMNGDEVAGENA